MDAMFYRRRLPHLSEIEQAIFLTWRLHDSLPPHRPFSEAAVNSGQAFATVDRLLDETRTGAFYLRQPPIADMIVESILYNGDVLEHFTLHAFVVMPNHVHLLDRRRLAQADEIAERHHGQASQFDAAIDGKAVLAGRKL